jgi:hypothetical protein
MPTESLNNITQDAFDQAEAVAISLLRSAMPNVDLRRGTVLRDLLVRPAASFYALESDRSDYLQLLRSLELMAASPDDVTADDVNAILGNFSITQRVGTKAYGIAMIKVSYDRTYVVPTSLRFRTLEGYEYQPQQDYTISSTADTTDTSNIQLQASNDGASYYFLLPVIATTAGAIYQIDASTALDVVGALDGFIQGEAYGDFTGGTDPETINDVITRLPTAISHRSLESRTSIEAILRSPEHGNFDTVLEAVSVQGYGDAAQLRDKHNAFGVAMGGKVDLYVRTFFRPTTVILQKTGTLVAPNTYQIDISATEAPGYYGVRAVTDSEDTVAPALAFSALPTLGSYDVTDTRSYTSIQATAHDIDTDNAMIETAYTTLQTGTILVNDVADADAATKLFKVELYVAPQLTDIQAYVDDDAVKNVKADYLVRCPLICVTSVRARVVKKSGSGALSADAMTQSVADYINSRSFKTKLTASEIVAVLHEYDIQRVDMSDDPNTGFQMQCYVRDAAGAVHTLPGPDLDLRSVADASVLLTADTCVFGADPADIYITIANE